MTSLQGAIFLTRWQSSPKVAIFPIGANTSSTISPSTNKLIAGLANNTANPARNGVVLLSIWNRKVYDPTAHSAFANLHWLVQVRAEIPSLSLQACISDLQVQNKRFTTCHRIKRQNNGLLRVSTLVLVSFFPMGERVNLHLKCSSTYPTLLKSNEQPPHTTPHRHTLSSNEHAHLKLNFPNIWETRFPLHSLCSLSLSLSLSLFLDIRPWMPPPRN